MACCNCPLQDTILQLLTITAAIEILSSTKHQWGILQFVHFGGKIITINKPGNAFTYQHNLKANISYHKMSLTITCYSESITHKPLQLDYYYYPPTRLLICIIEKNFVKTRKLLKVSCFFRFCKEIQSHYIYSLYIQLYAL